MHFIKALLVSLLFIVLPAQIASGSTHTTATADTTAKRFEPGKLIFHHIGDAYEWHIATFDDFHLSIPLPVILYSETSGFKAFMSTEFHHGAAGFESFHISHEGKYEGKIVETLPDGTQVRPWDISITKNTLSLFISIALILIIFLKIGKRYAADSNRAPKGLQSFAEPIILFIRDDVAKSAIGEEKYQKYLPYLLTAFFFIFINNLLGLVPVFPGGANLTGNIAVTMVLALFTFFITSYNASKSYWMHIINMPGVPWWLKFPIPLMPIVEGMGVIIKPFVLMVRLFANISAGHIIALGFYCLIFIFGEMNVYAGYGVSVMSVLFTVFMSLIELLVSFLQAYVFTLLSALYIGMAIENHGEH